jgi:hypothetical protein
VRRHFSNERSKQLSDTLEAIQRNALGSMGSLFASNDVDGGVRSVWNSDDCSLIPAFAYATAGPVALGHHQRVGVGSSKRS